MEHADLLEKEESHPVCGIQKHVGLYPGPAAVEAFANQLAAYKTSKGTIQFPYDKPLPLALIAKIAAWCGKEGEE